MSKEKIGTRYVAILIRIFVNPEDAADLKAVHALQDAFKVEQKSIGEFKIPTWDQASLKMLRDAINALVTANGGLDSAEMFGPAAPSTPCSIYWVRPPAGAEIRAKTRCTSASSQKRTTEKPPTN
ncbi:MAG: hypothetical protein QM811_21490 [Pirellulales bacterium]